MPNKRSDRVVLEANLKYWDPTRLPKLRRITFDNTLSQSEAVELVKSNEGRVDVVTELRPLDTLRVARSPFAKVVKARGSLWTVFGHFNMRKPDNPWHDIRLRRAVNYAINRVDLIRYATKGNGVIIPALVPRDSFGYDPGLAPYPFDPAKARRLLREAGYPDGLPVTLIAPEGLNTQATVVSKMLEHAGFTVDLQIFDTTAYNKKTVISHLEQPPEKQTWDIALNALRDMMNFPVFEPYYGVALGGYLDWGLDQPELRRLYEQVLRTVDREKQQTLIQKMERHIHKQASFLFLYNPIQLYAVNKAVEFVPFVNMLNLSETSVTDQHWSVRKQKAAVRD